eukprot:TRINITY_DN5559_c0_g1_i9.p1 TRINITY_DN5559_c0_g1~~TRINITY_DN5559_c0_g1_i9.p1  ORF type:complete len:859 (-),score=166.96 TRINITY_DN5559_c0_g1_i9:1499-4075(-)
MFFLYDIVLSELFKEVFDRANTVNSALTQYLELHDSIVSYASISNSPEENEFLNTFTKEFRSWGKEVELAQQMAFGLLKHYSPVIHALQLNSVKELVRYLVLKIRTIRTDNPITVAKILDHIKDNLPWSEWDKLSTTRNIQISLKEVLEKPNVVAGGLARKDDVEIQKCLVKVYEDRLSLKKAVFKLEVEFISLSSVLQCTNKSNDPVKMNEVKVHRLTRPGLEQFIQNHRGTNKSLSEYIKNSFYPKTKTELLVDCSSLDLQGFDLSQLNLRGSRFSNSNMSHCNLCGSDLRGVDFSYAILNHCSFSDAILDGASFFKAEGMTHYDHIVLANAFKQFDKAMALFRLLQNQNMSTTDRQIMFPFLVSEFVKSERAKSLPTTHVLHPEQFSIEDFSPPIDKYWNIVLSVVKASNSEDIPTSSGPGSDGGGSGGGGGDYQRRRSHFPEMPQSSTEKDYMGLVQEILERVIETTEGFSKKDHLDKLIEAENTVLFCCRQKLKTLVSLKLSARILELVKKMQNFIDKWFHELEPDNKIIDLSEASLNSYDLKTFSLKYCKVKASQISSIMGFHLIPDLDPQILSSIQEEFYQKFKKALVAELNNLCQYEDNFNFYMDWFPHLECKGQPPNLDRIDEKALPLICYTAICNQIINQIPPDKPLSASQYSLYLRVDDVPINQLKEDLLKVLKQVDFRLGSDVIGMVRYGYLYQIKERVDNSSLLVWDTKKFLRSLLPEQQKDLLSLIQKVEGFRKKFKNKNKVLLSLYQTVINELVKNVFNPSDNLHQQPWNRLQSAINIAKDTPELYVDLRAVDLEKLLNFKELDMGVCRIFLNPEQSKFLSQKQIEQINKKMKYSVTRGDLQV